MGRSLKSSPTIVDIARKLGISAMTVSRALNGKSDVSQEMREKVLQSARAMGYRPNRWARSLVTQRSLIVGAVIPEISHSFFSAVISGAERTLEEAGYDLLLCHSRSDATRERAEVHALIESQVDGLLVAPVQPERSPEPFVDLQKRKIPFVLIDRFFPGKKFSSVRANDSKVGALATEYLVKLGHRAVAHIAGPDFTTASMRRKAFEQTMRKHNLEVKPEWIAPGSYAIEGGRAAMQVLLKHRTRPTAVFAANDPQAVGAILACQEAGLRVPEDISIIGAGNIEGVYHPSPFLTTIDWPREELGEMAARILLKMISARSEPKVETHVFAPKLLVRLSTAPPAQ
jgi:LacI family transcriptional regulator